MICLLLKIGFIHVIVTDEGTVLAVDTDPVRVYKFFVKFTY